MKFIISILLTALLAFAAGFYLDWWSIALAAFLVAALIQQNPGKAYLSGFLGLFLLWALLAWWYDTKNEGILSTRVAMLFHLGGQSFLMILITGLIGALVGGFAALTGSYLRKKR